jgi:hypothetical protein
VAARGSKGGGRYVVGDPITPSYFVSYIECTHHFHRSLHFLKTCAAGMGVSTASVSQTDALAVRPTHREGASFFGMFGGKDVDSIRGELRYTLNFSSEQPHFIQTSHTYTLLFTIAPVCFQQRPRC